MAIFRYSSLLGHPNLQLAFCCCYCLCGWLAGWLKHMCRQKWSTTWTSSSHLAFTSFTLSNTSLIFPTNLWNSVWIEERRRRKAKQISVDIDYDYVFVFLSLSLFSTHTHAYIFSSNSLIFHFSSARFWYGLKMVRLFSNERSKLIPFFMRSYVIYCVHEMRLHWEFFRVCTTLRPRNEIANADKKNNAAIIMFKASDANETNVNNKKSARRAACTPLKWVNAHSLTHSLARSLANHCFPIVWERATKGTLFVGLIIINFN